MAEDEVLLYVLDNIVCKEKYNLESSTRIYNEIMLCDFELSAANKIALIYQFKYLEVYIIVFGEAYILYL